jgi:hypothetical protein
MAASLVALWVTLVVVFGIVVILMLLRALR